MASNTRPLIKVMPNGNHPKLAQLPHMTEAKIRKWLKHPTAGGFPAEGPAQWPRDQFTFARIQHGDVTVVEGDAGKAPSKSKPAPQHQNTRPE